MVEEMGELAHAMLKHEQGIRGLEDEVVAREKIADAWGDWLIFSMGLLDAYGMDAQNLLETTWARVKLRDFRKDPQTGGE
jgi:NTP pyrophosphatase (non-canonical NTP hydrolase)